MSWIKQLFVVIFFIGLTLKIADMTFTAWLDHQPEERGLKRGLILKEHKPNSISVQIPPDSYLLISDSLERKKYHLKIDEKGFLAFWKETCVKSVILTLLFIMQAFRAIILYTHY